MPALQDCVDSQGEESTTDFIGDDMNDWRDDGQAAQHADRLKFEQEEEEALRRVIKGTATLKDAETLAHATGHDFQKLKAAA